MKARSIHGSHLVITDALPRFVGEGDPPAPRRWQRPCARLVSAQRYRDMQSHPSEQMRLGQPS